MEICVLRAEILAKNKAENIIFFLKLENEKHTNIDGKLVGWGVPTGLKRGIITAAHPHTTFLVL